MTDLTRQQLTSEYVAGRAGGWAAAAARTLPWAFDDLTRDLGEDLYERMLLDPQVAASVGVLRASILAEGLRLSPAVENPDADGYALAVELDGFCESVIADMSESLDEALEDLLLAVALGSRVGEVTYRQEGRYLILDRINVKPRRAVAYVVDPHLNMVGMLGQRPGQSGVQGTGQVIVGDPAQVPGLLPLEKFLVVTFRKRDNDPRGTSVLRPAYNPWWVKQQTWPELLKYLAQFAGPSIWGTTAEKAQAVTTTNADGSITQKPAVQALLDALLAWRNGTAAAFPYGTVIDALEMQGEGQVFFNTFSFCDKQITVGTLFQTLATGEAEFGTRAQSQTHQDVLGTVIRQARRAVVGPLRRLLRRMVAYNYGDRAAQLTPLCTLGEVEAVDVAALWTAAAQLARNSYLHPSQLAGLDAQLGLPARTVAPGEAPAGLTPLAPAQQPPPAPPMDDDQEDEDQP